LKHNRAHVSVKLAAHEVPHAANGLYRRFRARVTLGRVAIVLILAAMIATPTALYTLERSKTEQLQSAYRQVSLELYSESAYWRSSTAELIAERDRLTDLVLDAGHAVEDKGKITVKVVATGYSSSIWECDMTPFITAANTPTRTGIMAMSRDLLTRYTPGAPFTFGDRVHVPGLGDFLVEDTMNARWTNRIDLWFPSRLEALRFGINEVYVSKTLETEADPIDRQDVSENSAASSTEGGGL